MYVGTFELQVSLRVQIRLFSILDAARSQTGSDPASFFLEAWTCLLITSGRTETEILFTDMFKDISPRLFPVQINKLNSESNPSKDKDQCQHVRTKTDAATKTIKGSSA